MKFKTSSANGSLDPMTIRFSILRESLMNGDGCRWNNFECIWLVDRLGTWQLLGLMLRVRRLELVTGNWSKSIIDGCSPSRFVENEKPAAILSCANSSHCLERPLKTRKDMNRIPVSCVILNPNWSPRSCHWWMDTQLHFLEQTLSTRTVYYTEQKSLTIFLYVKFCD